MVLISVSPQNSYVEILIPKGNNIRWGFGEAIRFSVFKSEQDYISLKDPWAFPLWEEIVKRLVMNQ